MAAWTLRGHAIVLMISLAFPSARALIVTRVKSFNFQNRDIQHRLGSLTVVRSLKGHWLFGVGYGNYPKVYSPYYTGPFHFLDAPDNQYLRWLIENGVVGFGVFLAFLIGLGRACLTHINTL